MNKAFLYTILALLGLAVSFLLFYQFTNQKQIAYVDSNRLVNEYLGMAKAREQFKDKTVIWQANLDTLKTDWNKALVEYQKNEKSMSAKEKALAQELVETKRQQHASYQQAINEMAQQEDQQMTTAVLEEVNGYITQYAEQHGYELIIAATTYGNLAYAKKELDITDQVLAGLNAKYEGK
ncbi:MAG: OmpH family outer membrane protein [Bacteroidota bacterium]